MVTGNIVHAMVLKSQVVTIRKGTAFSQVLTRSLGKNSVLKLEET